MVTDGRWKLVREYARDPQQAPVDAWYDLGHPFGERYAVDPPGAPVRDRLATAMQRFFEQYETPGHTGRRIWDQPAPNARMQDDFERD